MKKAIVLLPVIMLAACDRPQYNQQLVYENLSNDTFMVDAKIYKSHADLVVKRLNKNLRDRARGKAKWADHTWLDVNIPNVDDKIEISMPVNESGEYEVPGKIMLSLGRDGWTGGLTFTLWEAAVDAASMPDGVLFQDGKYVVGIGCNPIVYPQDVNQNNLSAEQKNCLNYIRSQLLSDYTKTEKRLRVYDEKTGREMYIGEAQWPEIFGGSHPFDFYLGGVNAYPDDAKRACDVAARMRAYIAAHIDAEYIPEPVSDMTISAGETVTIIPVDSKEIVISAE